MIRFQAHAKDLRDAFFSLTQPLARFAELGKSGCSILEQSPWKNAQRRLGSFSEFDVCLRGQPPDFEFRRGVQISELTPSLASLGQEKGAITA